MIYGRRGPPDAAAATTTVTPPETTTTTNHPWLSADHGWLVAGDLHLGEPVRLLDGATATVVALQALPGVGPMWDLSLAAVHTFAVGDAQAVVHNCDDIVRVREAGPTNPQVDHAPDFDSAREYAFKQVGWTEDTAAQWEASKWDETGTAVEFKDPDGAKVAYDGPHADMDTDLGHDQPHVGWQKAGKRVPGQPFRGNVTYDGPPGPARP